MSQINDEEGMKKLKDWIDGWVEDAYKQGYVDGCMDIQKDIETSIRRGHWIESQGGIKCSECGHFPLNRIIFRGEKIWEVNVNEDLRYCPYCGSKMDEAN